MSALVLAAFSCGYVSAVYEANLTTSDGCTTLQNSADAGATIKEVKVMCAMRTTVAHCGLEFSTDKGTYALAYNSQTVPGPINTAGTVWCQSGGMPMKDSRANGDCSGCGGWKISGSASGKPDDTKGSFGTLADFMKTVKKWGDDRPNYNIAACETGASNAANCQLTATQLYHKLTGKKAYKCLACDPNCFK